MKQHEGAKPIQDKFFGGSGLISKKYLLYDTFMTDRAAGSVNGTPAEPGPGGNRLIRDVESKISIANGVETWAAQATPVFADQDRVYSQLPITRAFGVVAICKWRLTTDNPVYPLALVTSTTPTWNHTHVEAGFYRSAALSLAVVYNATLGPVVAAIATDMDYLLAIELRAAGAKWYIKGGAFTNWTKLFEHTLGSIATLYVASAGYTAVFTLDDVRSPSRKFQDAPLASDDFAGVAGSLDGRLTNGLGHPEANGGAGKIWTGATWTVDGAGAAVNTPTQGADLIVNGGFDSDTVWTKGTGWTIAGGVGVATAANSTIISQNVLTIGTWYIVTWDITRTSGVVRSTFGGPVVSASHNTTGSHIDTHRAGGVVAGAIGGSGANAFTGTVDNIVFKALTLSTLFSSLVLFTVNVIWDCVVSALTTSTQAGLVARLDSAASPANFLIAYFDGAGNVKLDECVAGVYTNKLNAVKAFTASDVLRLDLSGSAWRLYHITAAGVVTLLGSGTTTVTTGNLFGKFSTYSGNAIESCNVYAVGAEGQWEALNQF